ncbi:hypothetical protein ANANG_G00231930 [Anguilla anguilla]|uniref:Helicase ATP-binding domain-containing protein n=1 Tax=Anguilla anguilla TaxID=7936 RepID=A0A9D3LX33_ANGAN|nr:hypothetical protein ANANG_G00231930 [Anguilla anguilla]
MVKLKIGNNVNKSTNPVSTVVCPAVTMAAPSVEYTIGGVKIGFPCKAYPSQLAMMNSIVRGLNHGQHCLLESPTGSGKSLALLCSALAWQQAQHAKAQEDASPKEAGKKPDMTTPCQCTCHATPPRIPSVPEPRPPVVDLTTPDKKRRGAAADTPPEEYTPRRSSLASRLAQKVQASLAAEDDDDFLPDRKRVRTPAADQKGRKLRCLERGVVYLDDESGARARSPGPEPGARSSAARPRQGPSRPRPPAL